MKPEQFPFEDEEQEIEYTFDPEDERNSYGNDKQDSEDQQV